MMAMLEDFCDLFRAVPVFDAFDLEIKVVGAHRGDHAKKADTKETKPAPPVVPPRSILGSRGGLSGKSAALDWPGSAAKIATIAMAKPNLRNIAASTRQGSYHGLVLLGYQIRPSHCNLEIAGIRSPTENI